MQTEPDGSQVGHGMMASPPGRQHLGLGPRRPPQQDEKQWLATHDEDWHRALDVQGALWRSGHVRAVGLPDLLIAAVAEREQVTLLTVRAHMWMLIRVAGQAGAALGRCRNSRRPGA
jgi:hypothetical protein